MRNLSYLVVFFLAISLLKAETFNASVDRDHVEAVSYTHLTLPTNREV